MHPAPGGAAFAPGSHAGAARSRYVRSHTHLHAVSPQEGRHGKISLKHFRQETDLVSASLNRDH